MTATVADVMVATLTASGQAGAGRFDLPGFVLSGAGLGTLIYALSQGPPTAGLPR